MYKFFRYFAFALFVLCNVIIATSAVWNLSLIQNAEHDWSAPLRSDGYSIFIGCTSLILIFPIFFCELATKDIFLTKVWFELIWLAVFGILQLVGAAVAIAAGQDQLCQPFFTSLRNPAAHPLCISSKLLQGFSLTCSLTLLVYFLLLMVFTLLKSKDDPTIWHCYVRKFPWEDFQSQLPSTPCSPISGAGLPRKSSKISLSRSLSLFRSKSPVIAAPRPRRAANDEAIREAILSYRSGLSLDYEIEHFAPNKRPSLAMAMAQNQPVMVTQPAKVNASFYPEYMQRAMNSMTITATAPASPPTATVRETRPLPPSPNVVGNWPQLNPPARRLGSKHKSRQTAISLSHPTDSRPPSSYPRRESGPASPPPAHFASPSHRPRPSGPRRPSLQIQVPPPTTQPLSTIVITDFGIPSR